MRKIFDKLHYFTATGLYFFMSRPAFARDLESIAGGLTTRTSRLALLIVPVGFSISAIFMAVGNPRGAQMMGMTVMASLVSIGGTALFNWLKNIVG